jgi:hypothetical protein
MDAPDTRKSSAITDHPFEPRTKSAQVFVLPPRKYGPTTFLPPSPYLCGHIPDAAVLLTRPCNLAEAAHSETTVKR